MPEGASIERRRMMRLMGAELVLTPSRDGMGGAIARADAIVAETPERLDAPPIRQPRQSRTSTPPPRPRKSGPTPPALVDAIVTGIGTGGSLTGIARALKPRRPGLHIVGVEPAESAVLAGDEAGPHGIQGIGAGFRPAVLDLDLVDELMAASEREAIATARLCARIEGIPIGISSGAVLHAMMALARRPAMEGRLIVGIAASFAERYMSTDLFAGF